MSPSIVGVTTILILRYEGRPVPATTNLEVNDIEPADATRPCVRVDETLPYPLNRTYISFLNGVVVFHPLASHENPALIPEKIPIFETSGESAVYVARWSPSKSKKFYLGNLSNLCRIPNETEASFREGLPVPLSSLMVLITNISERIIPFTKFPHS